uniref:Uncharacterized protein n=1 Tax=Candidatus Kentrum sp. TUN TaxID=2126343 RepID=A0A451A3L3_9GAMM|nr:MAG: hypothetical protein BECKTUN1418D_GA0071000_11312 [Candidatus Kentron sp. TUN]
MSETIMLTGGYLDLLKKRVPQARTILHNLAAASNDELSELAGTLEAMVEYPYIDYELILPVVHNLYLTTQNVLGTLDPENLITLLHIIAGNHSRAEETVKTYLERNVGCDDLNALPEYARDHLVLYRALQTFREHSEKADIRTFLERQNFDPSGIEEAIKIVFQPREVMAELDIPQCQDCSSCAVEALCSYSDLLAIHSTVTRSISRHNYDQQAIADLIGEETLDA